MSKEDLKDYPDFFKFAKKIEKKLGCQCTVEPFDQYQGPYILVDNRIRIWKIDDIDTNWFIADYHEHYAGYTALEIEIYKILELIFTNKKSKIPKEYFQKYTK